MVLGLAQGSDTGHCVKMYAFCVASTNKILLIKKARSQADMMNLRASAKPFNIRGVLAKKTLDEPEMYKAFLAAALTRVMRAGVPIPALASASVLQSAAVGGSVVGVVGPL